MEKTKLVKIRIELKFIREYFVLSWESHNDYIQNNT